MKQAKTRLVIDGILPEIKEGRLYEMNVDLFLIFPHKYIKALCCTFENYSIGWCGAWLIVYLAVCCFADWLEKCRPWKSWKTNWEAVWYPYRRMYKGKSSKFYNIVDNISTL